MDNEFVDLGFNNCIVDTCTYVDYPIKTTLKIAKANNPFSILQLNIKGILNKQEKLKRLIKDVGSTGMVHAIMLVETWLNKKTEKRVKIPGYKLYCFHKNGKKGGGVGILLSQSLDCRLRDDLSINIPDFESITLEVKTQQDSVLLTTIYRPPNSKEKLFLKTYQRLLKKFTNKQLERLIIGMDHNMDFMKHDQHSPTSDFIGLNLDHQLLPTITKPTRITRSSATLIDNILIGKLYQSDFESSIVVDDISDHFLLVLKTGKPLVYKKGTKEFTTRGINPSKCEEISQHMKDIDWDSLLCDKDTNEAFNIFHGILQSTIDTICPVHTVKVTKNNMRREP